MKLVKPTAIKIVIIGDYLAQRLSNCCISIAVLENITAIYSLQILYFFTQQYTNGNDRFFHSVFIQILVCGYKVRVYLWPIRLPMLSIPNTVERESGLCSLWQPSVFTDCCYCWRRSVCCYNPILQMIHIKIET